VATAEIVAGLTAEALQGSLRKDIGQLPAFTTTQHGLGKFLHHRIAIAVAVAAEQRGLWQQSAKERRKVGKKVGKVLDMQGRKAPGPRRAGALQEARADPKVEHRVTLTREL